MTDDPPMDTVLDDDLQDALAEVRRDAHTQTSDYAAGMREAARIVETLMYDAATDTGGESEPHG